jgi:adenylylsulfate kinase
MTRSPNTVWHHATVTSERREAQNRHKSCVLLFTGLSGSGKSTLAHAVEEQLHQLGCSTFVLDGNNVRHGLSSNLGFSEDDRKENTRRIGEAAKLMMEAGVIAMTAFISPFRADREARRKLMPNDDFFEIYRKANLETCEIARRLSTVKNCGQFVLLEQGVIKAKGTFSELTESNANFKLMSSISQECFL